MQGAYCDKAYRNLRDACLGSLAFLVDTVKSRYNEGQRPDWQNLFAIPRFRYIDVLFHIFYYYCGKENRSLYWLYRGLCYIEVRYIEVPLYKTTFV